MCSSCIRKISYVAEYVASLYISASIYFLKPPKVTSNEKQFKQELKELSHQVIDLCEDIARMLDHDPQPKNTLEELELRLDAYWTVLEKAEEKGPESKARRMERIIKQYENTIKAVKAGKQVDLSELPTPPGFSPIPVGGAAQPTDAPN